MIESVNNELIKRYAKLKLKKYRVREGLFIVEGEHLVEEALMRGILVDSFSLDGSVGKLVSEAVMKKLSSTDTCPNVLGIVKMLDNKKIEGNILILDGIQDPGNLGTIIRSAVAFGVDTIIASSDTVDVYNPKVLRSSEGMFFSLNYVTRDLKEIIPTLEGYQILTTNVLEGKNVRDVVIKEKFAVIMGNEGNGVRENIASLATDTLYIPMNEKCESLNVAIATSIILYELSNK